MNIAYSSFAFPILNTYIVIVIFFFFPMVRFVQELRSVLLSVQVKGQEGEGPKMVPKRQIQRKRKDSNSIVKETTEKLQVLLRSVHHQNLSFCIRVHLSVHLSRLKMGHL